MMIDNLIGLIVFILPAYIANASPVILGGGPPMDFGKKFGDGKRVLGDGKTWRGFFGGILAGTATGILLGSAIPGLLLSLGTLVGDTVGSFAKRRMGMERGKPSALMDQLTFLFIALLFAYPFLPAYLDVFGLVFLVALTYLLHVVSNVFAHRMGWKKVPW